MIDCCNISYRYYDELDIVLVYRYIMRCVDPQLGFKITFSGIKFLDAVVYRVLQQQQHQQNSKVC